MSCDSVNGDRNFEWLDNLLYLLFTTFPRDENWEKKFKVVFSDIKKKNITTKNIEEFLKSNSDPMEPICLEALEQLVHDNYENPNAFGMIRKYYGGSEDGLPVRLSFIQDKDDRGVMLTAIIEDNLSMEKPQHFDSSFERAFKVAHADAASIVTKGAFKPTRYCSQYLLINQAQSTKLPGIKGTSAYLSYLIPLLAHNKGEKLPTRVLFTGACPDQNGNVQKVAGINEKCKAAYRRGMKYVFVHEDNFDELESREGIPEVIQYYNGTPEEVSDQIFEYMKEHIIPVEHPYIADKHFAFTQLMEDRDKAIDDILKLSKSILDRNMMDDVYDDAQKLYERTNRRGIDDTEFEIEYRLLVCDYFNHKGNQDAPEYLEAMEIIDSKKNTHPEHYARAINKWSVGYHDVFCPEHAEKELETILKEHLKDETRGKIYGTRGQGFAYMKKYESAEFFLKKSHDVMGDQADTKRKLNYLVHLACDSGNRGLWEEVQDEDPSLNCSHPTLDVSIYNLHPRIKGVYIFGDLEEKIHLSNILEKKCYWKSKDETYKATVKQLAGLLNGYLYAETGIEAYKEKAVHFFNAAVEIFSTESGLLNDNLHICAKGNLALLLDDEIKANEALTLLRDIVTNKYATKLRSHEFDCSRIWNGIKELCSSSYDEISSLERIKCYTDMLRVFQWW